MEIIIGVCVVGLINFLLGMNVGKAKARKEGRIEGHTEGYQEGYNDGYELATVKARRDTVKWANFGR